jgi:hypothetical protein
MPRDPRKLDKDVFPGHVQFAMAAACRSWKKATGSGQEESNRYDAWVPVGKHDLSGPPSTVLRRPRRPASKISLVSSPLSPLQCCFLKRQARTETQRKSLLGLEFNGEPSLRGLPCIAVNSYQ